MNTCRTAAIILKHLVGALERARLEIEAAELADTTENARAHRVMSPADAAAYLGISESQLRILTDRGEIPCRRLSDRIVRYSERSLLRYVEVQVRPETSLVRRAG